MPNPMGESKNKGILIAAIIWVVIVGGLAAATKFLILPRFQNKLQTKTSSGGKYKGEIVIATDSFSGYAVLRSPEMKADLKAQGIKLVIQDDKADYPARMLALQERKIHLAVFTVDSFLAAGEKLGQFPATIVMVIDETQGADAIVSYKSAVGNLDQLNDPKARLVLTPQSPSEFLARTVIAHFNLPNLPSNWLEPADGAEDVYKKFVSADKRAPRAYVLWEPWVSKALATPDAQVLLDSSKLKGYIVDVLVVERKFLLDQPAQTRAVVEAYFRAAYAANQKSGGMKALVKDDADLTGAESLSDEQAERLVNGIQWKNTLDNFTYFGLAGDKKDSGVQDVDDIISNITEVLIKTGAFTADPLGGKANTIYYDQILRDLQAAKFHPGKKLNIIDGAGPANDEKIHTEAPLRALTDAEWETLTVVGEMRVEPIAFARGTARINLQSQRDLDDLAHKLKSFPRYYLQAIGHARDEGDPEANRQLARERAQAAADQIIAGGIDPIRVRVKSTTPSSGGAAQSVSFKLLQLPY
jgi:outer membrane protein OmpA-like peptidoglycan-associated protein